MEEAVILKLNKPIKAKEGQKVLKFSKGYWS